MKETRQQLNFQAYPVARWRERAFSLHELLVTLAMVAALSAFAIPVFHQLSASQRISGAINNLITALHLARSEAIKRRERAILCPSANGQTCLHGSAGTTTWESGYLLYIDRNSNHDFDTNEVAIRHFDGSGELHIHSSVSRNHVVYYPNGLTPASNLTITFCDKRDRARPRAIIVSNNGRVRTSTRTADGDAIVCPRTG